MKTHTIRRLIAAFLIALLTLIGIAYAETSADIETKYAPDMDWFSAEAAMSAILPDGLSEREAEIYREAFALGHYRALHPEHIEGMYVVNTKTGKFHYSDCQNTLFIDSSNRKHILGTKEELMQMGYEPCGSCKP